MSRYQKEGPDKKNNYKIRDTEMDRLVKDSSGRVLRKYEADADRIIEKLEEKPFDGYFENKED